MGDIETFYGGSILAMVGKDCFSIVSDKRLGNNAITVSKSFRRIFKITDRTFIGLPAFVPDCQQLVKKVMKHVSLFRLDERREIEPQELANLVSAILYSQRKSPLMTSPIVVGLDSNNKTYICNMDCLGCKTEPGNFVAEGTASTSLTGACEVLYRENMEEEDLFVVSVQAFLNSVDRNALSGWGVECTIVSSEGIKVRTVRNRCD